MAILFLIATTAFDGIDAQQNNELPESFRRPILSVKFVPIALMDYTPTLQFAAELRLQDHQGVQFEYGYVFSPWNSNTLNTYRGFKLKGEYRLYDLRPEKIMKSQFIGLQYMHKQLTVEGSDYFWRQNRTYQELLPLKLINYTNAIYFVVGRQYPLFGSVQLELSVGLGARRLDVKYIDLPEDAEFVDFPEAELSLNINPVNGEGSYLFPGLFFSLKIIVPIIK